MLIDAHAHLDQYHEKDVPNVVASLGRHRISTISVSMDPQSFIDAERIAARSNLVLATFGIHPWYAHLWADRLDDVEQLMQRSPMVGEIGLDYHFIDNPDLFEAQQLVFHHLIAKAVEQNKIVNIHCTGAELDALEVLRRYECERVIIHWFDGPLDLLDEMVNAGYFFTLGVEVLVSDHVKAVARRIPLDRLLTETDNPGGQRWLTGETGMPSLLVQVVAELGRVRGMSARAVELAVQANVERLVGNDPLLQRWLDESRP